MTAVTEAEVRTGISLLPDARRCRALVQTADRAFDGLSAGRVLSFDSVAARSYAKIATRRHAAGRPVSLADGQVAAIAKTNGMAIATGSVRAFESTLSKWVHTIL